MTLSEQQIAELVVANDDFDTLEKSLDVFCPFEAIGMVRQEIRHGHFLSYIFDPQRPHGFDDNCIRALMAAAARSNDSASSSLSLLEIHLMDFDSAIIRREWRKIDILIEVPDYDLIVAIELKIDAAEHSGQLARYRNLVEVEWPEHRHLFLFLTRQGDEPSDDGAGWQSVNLDALVAELQSIAAKQIGVSEARQLLGAYLAMLGRHLLIDEKLEELAARLWSKHEAALSYLSDRRPDSVANLFQQMVERRDATAESIAAQVSEKVIVDSWSRASIQFAVPDWDGIQGFLSADGFTPSKRLILLQLVKAGPDYFRCYFQLGKGDQAMREKLFQCLRDGNADVGKKMKPTKEWNRLASIRISLPDLDENPDMEAHASKVFNQVRDFAAKHIPTYSAAFASLDG